MNPKHAKLIDNIFGEKFLQYNDVPNYGCVKITLMCCDRSSGQHVEIRKLSLEEAAEYELQDSEAIQGRVHNGKGFMPAVHGLIPSTGFEMTANQWNAIIRESTKEHTKPAPDNFKNEIQKVITRMEILMGNPKYNSEAIEQCRDALAEVIRIVGENESPDLWQALYYAYQGGAWNAHTHATEEHLADITGGLAHTKQQHGRNNGSKNKKSKVKDKGQANAEYERKKKEIIELWNSTSDHEPYAFMDTLVERGLADEGEEKYTYQLAGKGKSSLPEVVARKIRRWVTPSYENSSVKKGRSKGNSQK